jgi:dihydrofolate reductase
VVAGDVVGTIQRLKTEVPGDILVHGSAALVRWLLGEGLLDELRLAAHPVVPGEGAGLFDGYGGGQAFEPGALLFSYAPAQDAPGERGQESAALGGEG